MKIAMVGTRGVPARYGGFETCVEEVGRRLVDRGHEVVVYCRTPLNDSAGGAPELPAEHLGMRLVHLPAVRHKVLETLSHTGLSAGHLFFHRADAALVFNAANSVFLPALRAACIPVATHVDGLEWRRAKWGGAGRSFYRRAESLAVRWSDALIADADGIADYYRDEFDADTVRIAYGAPIISAQQIGHAGIDELGLSPQGYHLAVARFEPENHVDVIVDGYVRSGAEKPLVVVGSAPYSDQYTARVRALGDDRVRFLGGVWDQNLLDQLYANSATYLHGHSVGGTNPSLLRAIGAGAPSICFDVEFNREVTRAAGRYFRGADDVARLVEAAEADPAATVTRGRAGQQRARDYDWDDVAGRYEQLAAELPARRAARLAVPSTSRPTGARVGPRPRVDAPAPLTSAPVFTGRRALVLGTFDVLRASQLELLARAGRECDRVTIGVLDRTASDPVAPRHEVVNTLTDRLLLAQHLRGVDEVVDVDDLDPVALAKRFDVVYLDDTVGLEPSDRTLAERLEIVDVLRDDEPRLRIVTNDDLEARAGNPGFVVGYIPGAWDALHAGHIAILDRARQMCDRLVVGVADDETLLGVKGRLPLVPHEERMAIVASLSMADEVVADRSSDKRQAWNEVHFDVLFKGTDWQGTPKGVRLEAEMAEVGARLEYLPLHLAHLDDPDPQPARRPDRLTVISTAPQRSDSVRAIHAHLRAVQKPSLGAPLYSLLVNRRLGRVFAAVAFKLGLSPNAVTGVSALLSACALAVLVLVHPTWLTGVAVAVLLSLGYAVDSADGQVARLSGRAGPAGEWLDHMVDAVKTSALHLAVLVACFRFHWAWGAGADGWLLVPILFAVVGASVFFGMTLVEQLRRQRGRGGPAGSASLVRTLFSLPMDYGLLCVSFVLWGSGAAFAVGYGLLFLGTAAFWLVAWVKWFRDMKALADVPPLR